MAKRKTLPPAKEKSRNTTKGRSTNPTRKSKLEDKTWWRVILNLAVIVSILGGLAEFLGYISIFKFNNNETLTVRISVQRKNSEPLLELQNKARLSFSIGKSLYSPLIGENATTLITDVPIIYKGDSVKINLISESFSLIDPEKRYALNTGSIEIKAQAVPIFVKGVVRDYITKSSVEHAIIIVEESIIDSTDEFGRFNIQVPEISNKKYYKIYTAKSGFKPNIEYCVPKSTCEIRLKKQ